MSSPRPRMTGIGRVLVVVYAIMALAATGRSFVQIVAHFDQAPIPYALSAVAAVVYILATVALVKVASRRWSVVAWVAICFELAGVLLVGTLSLVLPDVFSHNATVWSGYGYGYFWIPLVLPLLGLWWLARGRGAAEQTAAADERMPERSSW